MGNRHSSISIHKEWTREEDSSVYYTEIDPVPVPPPVPPRLRLLRRPAPKIVNCGDIVRCKDFEILRRHNPLQQESFLEKIANKRCVIVSKSATKLTLLHLLKRNDRFGKIVGTVGQLSCTLETEARTAKISDGTLVRLGSFVKFNWVGKELETYKTGVVSHIFLNGLIRVQLATGVILNYPADALVSSDESKIETTDAFDSWIGINSPVRIIKNRHIFTSSQKANGLPYDDSYLKLMGKTVTVVLIELIPYVTDKDIVVISEGRQYTVNANIVFSENEAENEAGDLIQVGDAVELIKDIKKVKVIQTPEFGGWSSKHRNKRGKIGTVEEINVSTRRPVTSVRVKVRYSDGDTILFHPKALSKISVMPKSGNKESGKAKEPEKTSFVSYVTTHFDPLANYAEKTEMTVAVSCRRLSMPRVNDGLLDIPKKSLQIFDNLGEGKFGNVYSGKWGNEECAIKVLKKDYYDPEFLREAAIQSSLQHPNIVEIYGVNTEDNNIWMVMKLIRGTDLHRRLWDVSENLSIPTLLKMAKQLANAISYLHETGYLHGDIKSSNVMVEASTHNVLLCDFGASMFLGVERGNSEKEYTSHLCGTLFYMAPECLEVNEEKKFWKSFKSDVWCLGAMFLEMFTSRDLEEFYSSFTDYKSTGNIACLQVHWRNLPPEIKDVIAASLRISPEDRPTSSQINNSLMRKC